VCFGKLSLHFLTMPELRRKPPDGTTSLLLSICYYFSIWLGCGADFAPLNDSWPNSKWARTHRTDCHQVWIGAGEFQNHVMLLSDSDVHVSLCELDQCVKKSQIQSLGWSSLRSNIYPWDKKKLRGLSPLANYTERATAACRRS
jgi:hypothetical protein